MLLGDYVGSLIPSVLCLCVGSERARARKEPLETVHKSGKYKTKMNNLELYFWSNYSDLTRPHPKWWFSKGNHLISGKSMLVKYYNLPRYLMSKRI